MNSFHARTSTSIKHETRGVCRNNLGFLKIFLDILKIALKIPYYMRKGKLEFSIDCIDPIVIKINTFLHQKEYSHLQNSIYDQKSNET